MEWTQATMGICVITSIFGSSAACCAIGFGLRARLERRIRNEYRVLFGACRRSMAHANEYATPHGRELDSHKTTEFRRRARRATVPAAARLEPLTVQHDLNTLARAAEERLAWSRPLEVNDA